MPFSRRLVRLFLCLFLMGQAGYLMAGDAATKLNFLLNFARFAEWPSAVLAPGSAVRYCFAPGDPELSREASWLESQQIQGHVIKVTSITKPTEVAGCHVLFIPADMTAPLAPFLKVAEGSCTLTVSDLPEFVDKDGMVELVPVSGRYRFSVNLVVAKRAGLYLNTNLLKLARSVN